jgi:hypothetical protein
MLPSERKLEIARKLAQNVFNPSPAQVENELDTLTGEQSTLSTAASFRRDVSSSPSFRGDPTLTLKRKLGETERIARLKRKRIRRTLKLINNADDEMLYTMEMERDLVVAYNIEKLVEELNSIAEKESFKLITLVKLISERLKVFFLTCLVK